MRKIALIEKIQDSYKTIRLKKDVPLRYVARPFEKIGITPNMITVFGFLCAIISVYFLFENHTLFVVFYLLNYFCDLIDGTLARMRKIENPNGIYIDAISDALFGVLILIKSYFHFRHPFVLVTLFIYLWEARKVENWASGFYPNITWLKFSYLFKLFSFGLTLQFLVSVFNISMRKIFNLKYVPEKQSRE